MNVLKKIHGRQQELQLMSKLRRLDHADGDPSAMVAPIVTGNQLITMGPGKYNPPFKAQIQVNILKYYFSEAAGVYTEVAAAALAADLKVSLPFFLFANSDFASGYAKLQAQYVLTNWSYEAPVRYGKDYPATATYGADGLWDATVRAKLRNGDVVLPFTAASGGTNYTALVVLRTADVPMSTLLDATNSNTFNINLIRYTVTAGQETQFANAILTTDETMFGKFSSDPINPESFKNPEQQQDNIVDLDVKVDINKQKGLASQADFDVVNLRWNLFIASAQKII